MPKILTFEARDSSTIRDGMLRVISNGLTQRGVASPNVTAGSDWYVLAQAVANQLAVVEANAIIKADDGMPDSAEGDNFSRLTDLYGLSLRPAAGSAGPVILTASTTTTVATGAQLIDSAGLRFRVVTGGSFGNGDSISVQAIDTGEATNHAEGDVLRWLSAPPYADEKALVGVGGLVNGHDAEQTEGLRSRLYARLRNPPRSGNWQHAAELAEESSPVVEKAFVYPALQGPATMHVAVTAATTDTSKERDVVSTTMTGTVVPYVQGQLPEHAYIVTTTVANVPVRVAFAISIPEALTASPPGPGGGWLDGSPWPDVGATGNGCIVTAVNSSTSITVDATVAPYAQVTRVSWLSASDWVVRTARVLTVSGTSGAYAITLDTPFTGITVGDQVWPACTNGQAYADAVIASFAAMGPGEKTSNVSALIRGYRRPRPETAWPYALGPQMIRDLVHSQAEMAYAYYMYRDDGTASLSGPTGVLTPPVPGSVSNPPNIYIPDNIGFYRAT